MFRFALAFFFISLSIAYAAPAPDSTFGVSGSVRIGVLGGFEDTAYASAIQGDGKVIVAGTSTGRQNYAFVTRFTTGGAPDPAFGTAGALLMAPPAGYVWMTPIQIALQADGSMVVVSVLYNGFTLTRITAGGALDAGFGNGGLLVFQDPVAFNGNDSDGPIRVAIQPDGKLLVVTPVSGGANFVLRFRRFLADGAVDASFGSNGDLFLGDPPLPVGYAFTSTKLAHAEPGGGFTIAAASTFADGAYLLLRVTNAGALDPSFHGIGLESGFDVGNPFDVPTQLERATDNGYLLVGYPKNTDGSRAGGDVLWKINAQGAMVTTFASGGRLTGSDADVVSRNVVSLADGGVAIAQALTDAKVRIARFDANGMPVAVFGTGGSVTLDVPGYKGGSTTGIHVDAAGRLTVTGSAYARIVFSGTLSLPRARDVLLAGVTPAGIPRTDFGTGDGIALWNDPAYSNDRIDALRFDAPGRIILVGFSDGSERFDYLLSRLTPDGAVDPGYGAGGRLYPQQNARFVGVARAAQGPDDSVVVASGEAFGSFGTVRAATIFRATASGALDATFKPAILAAGPNAAVGLAARPDGRVLYGTNDPAGYVLQQFLPDGSSDPGFGTNGSVSFPLDVFDNSVSADLVVLVDGSSVFGVFSSRSLRLYKVDAHGVPVASFGTDGLLAYPLEGMSNTFTTGPTLLALADGTLLAAQRVVDSSGATTDSSLFVLRATADGRVISAEKLLPAGDFPSWALTGLPDSSVIIARNSEDASVRTAKLYRLLPDNQFDAAFAISAGNVLPGFTTVTALAIDAGGHLLVAGQDAMSAIVARYTLDGPVAGVSVVEYFNVNLGHYFVTANAAEMASIESGGAGPGWQRTGFGFNVWVPEAGVQVGAQPVCRFYGTPGSGPNSHFYTVDTAECAIVKTDPGWTYEGTAFYTLPPIAGQCAAGRVPVARAYNNRFAQNDSNHRYTVDLAVYQSMIAQGWTGEGVRFCGPAS